MCLSVHQKFSTKKRHLFEILFDLHLVMETIGSPRDSRGQSSLTPSLYREASNVLKIKMFVAEAQLAMQGFCLLGLPSVCACIPAEQLWPFPMPCEWLLRYRIFQETQESGSRAPAWTEVSLVSLSSEKLALLLGRQRRWLRISGHLEQIPLNIMVQSSGWEAEGLVEMHSKKMHTSKPSGNTHHQLKFVSVEGVLLKKFWKWIVPQLKNWYL